MQCAHVCRVLCVRVLSFKVRTAVDIPSSCIVRGRHVPAPPSLSVQGRHGDSPRRVYDARECVYVSSV